VLLLLAVTARGETTIDLLRHVPLFAALSEEDLARVAEVATTRRFEPDEIVFREGDDSSTCYVIRSGHACALRGHSDGRTITLARFGPGDIFGELAMFDDERRSATVQALDELEVIAILGRDMRRLLFEHPEIAVKLIRFLGRRLRETNERLAGQSFETVQTRVAKVLAQLVEAARAERARDGAGAGGGDGAAAGFTGRHDGPAEGARDVAGQGAREGAGQGAQDGAGEGAQDGAGEGAGEGAQDGDILITATQAELARLAGSSRESASRFLADLVRAGIITQGRGRLTVHDPAALERYVY
jgi:CRP/FNR family transcriptional regulator, cyclic AMP receptor protein